MILPVIVVLHSRLNVTKDAASLVPAALVSLYDGLGSIELAFARHCWRA